MVTPANVQNPVQRKISTYSDVVLTVLCRADYYVKDQDKLSSAIQRFCAENPNNVPDFRFTNRGGRSFSPYIILK